MASALQGLGKRLETLTELYLEKGLEVWGENSMH
jgi:hypothetical protein